MTSFECHKKIFEHGGYICTTLMDRQCSCSATNKRPTNRYWVVSSAIVLFVPQLALCAPKKVKGQMKLGGERWGSGEMREGEGELKYE